MFTLDQVVPWGRSFDEYRQMFAITDADLGNRILGCGDGPASFNAHATRWAADVVSCDPIYRWSAADIESRIAQTFDEIMEQTRQNQHEFVWESIASVDDMGRARMAAMQDFLADFLIGRAQGRYIEAVLPSLPFADQSFDLALCSHLLFLYSEQLGEEFHRSAVMDLCRVAREIRIFPLLALGSAPSPFVETTAGLLRDAGKNVTLERVPYEFQRGGNEMMRIRQR